MITFIWRCIYPLMYVQFVSFSRLHWIWYLTQFLEIIYTRRCYTSNIDIFYNYLVLSISSGNMLLTVTQSQINHLLKNHFAIWLTNKLYNIILGRITSNICYLQLLKFKYRHILQSFAISMYLLKIQSTLARNSTLFILHSVLWKMIC